MLTSDTPDITVLCVDDSPDIAGLLDVSISGEQGMCSVGAVHDSSSVLDEVAAKRPDIVVLDLTMPGKSPLEVIAEINASFPQTRTIVYSGHDDPESIDRAIEAGAWGYVSKHEDFKQVIEAVRRVAKGELVLAPR